METMVKRISAEEAKEKLMSAVLDYAEKSDELTRAYVEAKNELNKMFNARCEAIKKAAGVAEDRKDLN